MQLALLLAFRRVTEKSSKAEDGPNCHKVICNDAHQPSSWCMTIYAKLTETYRRTVSSIQMSMQLRNAWAWGRRGRTQPMHAAQTTQMSAGGAANETWADLRRRLHQVSLMHQHQFVHQGILLAALEHGKVAHLHMAFCQHNCTPADHRLTECQGSAVHTLA